MYPTRKQEALLNRQLEECRWLYNHFLEHRKNAWEWYGVSLSHYGQQNTLPSLKKIRPSLETVYSQTLQNVAVRIDLATFERGFNMFNAEFPLLGSFAKRGMNACTVPCFTLEYHYA